MFQQKFNQPYYEIKLSEIDDKTIGVLKFEGDEQISGLYEYRIDIVSKETALDSSKILNKPAGLSLIRGEEEPEHIHGIVSTFEQYGRAEDYTFYKLVLVPRLWRLNLVYQNEVYQDMKIDDVIKEILSDAGLTGSTFKIDLKNQYPKQEYIVQYRETNFNFLNRRLEHFGIHYHFDNSNDSDVVVFTDSNSKLSSIHQSEAVGFNENVDVLGDGESIIDLVCKEKVVTGAVQLKDYNYLFPEKQLLSESQINSKQPGIYYDYGDNFENEKDGEFLAKIRNQEFVSESIVFEGLSDSRLLRAGHRFKIETHFRNNWNSEYVLTKVSVKGTQHGVYSNLIPDLESAPVYECSFTAIPFNVEYRPKRKTPVPKISGIMSGRIDGPAGEELFIDEHGRYKSKMFFDISDAKDGEASLWIRLQQSSSGSGYGIHFPNRIGTELIWACVDGNVDRPVGLGTIPNPSQATPVADKNKLDNIIRTASGNQLIMNDKEKETHIKLMTTDGHTLFFDDKDDRIEITTKGNHTIVMDDKNKSVTISSKDLYRIHFDDENQGIVISSGKKGHAISISDSDGNEFIKATDSDEKISLTMDITNNKITMESKEGDIDILAPKGNINIKSKTLKIETESDAKLKTGTNLDFQVGTDFKTKVQSNLEQEASMNLKQKGMNVTSEASVEHKSKGLNLTVEAGVNMQVKGTMVTVQSTGPNTIKGLPVQIN